MGSPDFLRTHAETPLCERYTVGGLVCSLATNSERLLAAARESFPPLKGPSSPADLALRFWVDDDDAARPPWPKPYVRGLDELVFIGLDSRSSVLADLRKRRIIGRISPALAGDSWYWRTVVFPILFSIVAGSIGLVELHASCVARDHKGVVLVGPSRSGKSTLAMAFVEAGFRLLSDDRVFASVQRDGLLAFGLSRPLKLRRDAVSWFQQARAVKHMDRQGEESVYYIESKEPATQQTSPSCEPRAVLFLERQEAPGFRAIPMDHADARHYIEMDVMAEAPRAIKSQERVIDALLTLPCWRLQYGGTRPQVIAEQILRSLLEPAAFGL